MQQAGNTSKPGDRNQAARTRGFYKDGVWRVGEWLFHIPTFQRASFSRGGYHEKDPPGVLSGYPTCKSIIEKRGSEITPWDGGHQARTTCFLYFLIADQKPECYEQVCYNY